MAARSRCRVMSTSKRSHFWTLSTLSAVFRRPCRPKCSRHRNYSKTVEPPRRPFEKERLDQEMKVRARHAARRRSQFVHPCSLASALLQLLGEYGLRCKREIWRSQLALAKVRSAARKLLTLDEKDPKRMFEGDALIRRLVRYGVLTEDEKKLDDVLRLSTQRFLERRLQTKVLKMNYAKSIHHARVLIRQRHIRVGKQLVNSPQFLVRTDSEGHIDFSLHSPYNPSTGRPVSFAATLFSCPPVTLAPRLPVAHSCRAALHARRPRPPRQPVAMSKPCALKCSCLCRRWGPAGH